jgi:hypothetical protein
MTFIVIIINPVRLEGELQKKGKQYYSTASSARKNCIIKPQVCMAIIKVLPFQFAQLIEKAIKILIRHNRKLLP